MSRSTGECSDSLRFADAARPMRHATGDRWFVDETYVKVSGRWRYLYRAVDQYGQVIDVLLSAVPGTRKYSPLRRRPPARATRRRRTARRPAHRRRVRPHAVAIEAFLLPVNA